MRFAPAIVPPPERRRLRVAHPSHHDVASGDRDSGHAVPALPDRVSEYAVMAVWRSARPEQSRSDPRTAHAGTGRRSGYARSPVQPVSPLRRSASLPPTSWPIGTSGRPPDAFGRPEPPGSLSAESRPQRATQGLQRPTNSRRRARIVAISRSGGSGAIAV